MGILAFRPGGLGFFLPARKIWIARLEVRNDLLAIVQRFVQARLEFQRPLQAPGEQSVEHAEVDVFRYRAAFLVIRRVLIHGLLIGDSEDN